MISKLIERYKHTVALITGDVRRYEKASDDVKTAFYLTPAAAAVPLTLYLIGVLRDAVLLTVVCIGMGLSAWTKVLDTVTALQSFRKRLEEELPFFTLSATAVSKTGLEPVELLRFLSNSKAFSAFGELGRRFWSLSEVFGSSEGLTMLFRLAGGRVGLFLIEYASALSSGTALQHLRDRASDFVRTVAVEVDGALLNRMAMAMMVSMFFSTAPVILIAMSTLFTASLEGRAPEVPALIQVLAPVIASASMLLAIVLPGYPLASQVIVDGRTLTLYKAAFVSGMTLLALPPTMLSLELVNLSGFRELAFYSSLTAIGLGVLSFTSVFKALMTRIDDVVEGMAQHVRIFRSMHLFKSEKLEKLMRKPVRPWLVDYLKESMEFFRVLGDVDPSIFDLFVMFVLEVQRAMRKAMTHVAFMTAVVLLTPVLSTATISLGAGLGVVTEALLASYASVLGFGCVAGKIALGRNASTLLPGTAALLYALTLTA